MAYAEAEFEGLAPLFFADDFVLIGSRTNPTRQAFNIRIQRIRSTFSAKLFTKHKIKHVLVRLDKTNFHPSSNIIR